ncbi:MAG: hypothetical protein R3302_01040 [Sulfurimonadaceae bacterium]|nr:hypothetical protein [Sulfurimonadaceae bacterium]
MKKFLVLLFICQSLLFGYTYNDLLIKAQTALFPKILLLDKNLSQKLVNEKIVYIVAYEEHDLLTAMQVVEYLHAQFSEQLDEHRLDVRLVPFHEIDEQTRATAIYVLHSESHIGRVADIAQSQGIMTFAYDIVHLREGLLFSLMVEKSTVLYLAKESLPAYRIEFIDVLYQIVRFMDE